MENFWVSRRGAERAELRTPASIARRASSTRLTPLSRNEPSHCSRSQATSSQKPRNWTLPALLEVAGFPASAGMVGVVVVAFAAGWPDLDGSAWDGRGYEPTGLDTERRRHEAVTVGRRSADDVCAPVHRGHAGIGGSE